MNASPICRTQNQVLDERANSLSNIVAGLDAQIAETQQKLAHSETNNMFLAAQLKQQMAQRAELERKFNDLNDVRSQVRKLREELLIARRLEWMRAGTDPTAQRQRRPIAHGTHGGDKFDPRGGGLREKFTL